MAWYEEAREQFAVRMEAVKEEEDLEELLAGLTGAARDELARWQEPIQSADEAEEALVAVEAWASLASYACARFYVDGPAEVGTRWRRLGGMSKGVVSRLQKLAEEFAAVLREACRLLAAASFSISIGFPLGVSIGLSW
jgi:hypothetical protein